MFLISLLDLFGLRFLTAFGDDQGLDAAGHIEVAVRIQAAEITGAKPAILRKGFGRLVGQIVVACKNPRPPRQDLALLTRLHACARRPLCSVLGSLISVL